MSLIESCLVDCPYCGEQLELAIDAPEGRHQYTEDCHVCCQPIAVDLVVCIDGSAVVQLTQENE